MQLILESAGPGFTAAYTQLGGLSLSARHHSGERNVGKGDERRSGWRATHNRTVARLSPGCESTNCLKVEIC